MEIGEMACSSTAWCSGGLTLNTRDLHVAELRTLCQEYWVSRLCTIPHQENSWKSLFQLKLKPKPAFRVPVVYQNPGVLCLTNRFHVAVRLFNNRSQMTTKCGKNKILAHEAIAECVTDVLNTF